MDVLRALSKLQRPSWKWFIFHLLSLLSLAFLGGCGNQAIDRGISTGGGFWEQNEFTDPRFTHFGRGSGDVIGVLRGAGQNVFLNGSRINRTTDVINGSVLRTEQDSAARIDFVGSAACQIFIEDFRTGEGYGESANCRHRVVTRNSDSETRQASTAYHIKTDSQRTIVTVLSGLVTAAPLAASSQQITLGPMQEAVLAKNRIINGPYQVTARQIRERIDWRNRYQFSDSAVDWGTVAAGVAAVGIGILIKNILDKDDNKDDNNNNNSSNSHEKNNRID